MKPRAVLFDLDGVLLHSYEVWFQLLNGAARDWGYPPVTREQFAAGWGQGVAADQRFYPRHSVAQIEAYYDANFERHLDHLVVEVDVPRVFAGIAARGLASAVVTNTPNPLATRLVERAGARPGVVVGGTDVPRGKPAPDMVHAACALLGVAESEALVVGDTHFDREAARAAGVRFVGLRTEGAPRIEALGELLALL